MKNNITNYIIENLFKGSLSLLTYFMKKKVPLFASILDIYICIFL